MKRPTMSSPRRLLTAAAATGFLLVALPIPVVAADDSTQCTFPSKKYPGRPWSLQRVLMDELWKQSTGKGVRVAVVDTGVDVKNPQLTTAVDVKAGRNLMRKDLKDANGGKLERGKENGTTDTVGHGTKVAGIIAAREAKGTGFTGLAPDATIIPIQQNDADGNGTAETLAQAIRYAADTAKADIINISQDTADALEPTPLLKQAVDHALAKDIVVVASAGNDGMGGNVKPTYPASYEG
ncbi:S8 family serine peptidase, partial [Streptomyces sp. MBT57]|nr:S8 family serine peptidase [Streptomyces sp. MBT57]